jgi:DNA-binding MarR family transcriptional regulator
MSVQAPTELQVAVMRLARRLRLERGDHGLTLTQLSVLATLDRHGPMTPGELAAHERVRPPSMTRTVASLDDLGLVTREDHPTDGRQVVVRLTSDAEALLAADRAQRAAWLESRVSQLSAEEQRTLADAVALLDRLAQS